MSNWAYCTSCGNALPYPTPRQIADDDYTCGCGEKNNPRKTLGEVLEELFERIERLEDPPEGIECIIDKDYT